MFRSIAVPVTYAVWVEFQILPAAFDSFMPLMLANAQASLADEDGCRLFDVLLQHQDSCTVCLYELYDNRTALEAHLASAHFKAFATATAPMIASRRMVTGDIVPSRPALKQESK